MLCVGWFGGGIIRLLRCGIIGINKNYNCSTRPDDGGGLVYVEGDNDDYANW
ncbi:MAG: hypothetical protein LBQ98_00965 [Nitrososphaerota archaeon]|nr:hypothetical protein [Nitrososphaerota archaeon]